MQSKPGKIDITAVEALVANINSLSLERQIGLEPLGESKNDGFYKEFRGRFVTYGQIEKGNIPPVDLHQRDQRFPGHVFTGDENLRTANRLVGEARAAGLNAELVQTTLGAALVREEFLKTGEMPTSFTWSLMFSGRETLEALQAAGVKVDMPAERTDREGKKSDDLPPAVAKGLGASPSSRVTPKPDERERKRPSWYVAS